MYAANGMRVRAVLYYGQPSQEETEAGSLPDIAENRFRSGASSMVAAVFVAKLLGILFVVPLQNLIGGYALGLYQLAYPVYTIVLTLATAGFPIALSKSISDQVARGMHKEAGTTFAIVGRTMILFGVASSALLWFVAPLYLDWTLPDSTPAYRAAALPAIRALAPALLLVPLMSAERGYLQGYQRLQPSAMSQVAEQIARVFFVLAGTLAALHMRMSPSGTAAVATSGALVGAAAAFSLLLPAVKKLRREMARKVRHALPPRLKPGRVLTGLFLYSLPVALGTLVFPLSSLIDALTVQRQLVLAGMGQTQAMVEYGIYSGEAMRLMQVPLSFATAIGASVMPAIAGAVAVSDHGSARLRMVSALRLTAFVTFPAVAVLLVLSGPLNTALFTSSGAGVIAVTSIMAVFSALELVTTYILQGFNRFYQPVAHMLAGAAVRLAFNLALIPLFGILGAAAAGILGYMVSAWLNMQAVRRVTRTSLSFPKTTWPALAASALTAFWFYGALRIYEQIPALHSRPLALATVLFATALGIPLYLSASLWLKAADREELSVLPLLGRYFR